MSTATRKRSRLTSLAGQITFYPYVTSYHSPASTADSVLPQNTPQQENGYDCGVFTCQFLEALSRGEEDFAFTQANMPYLRRKMVWEIGHAKLRDEP